MARSPLEEHAPDVTREIMGRLSPEAMRTLRAVSEMRNRPAEDVLREELRGYIADKLPLPDVEAIIHAMGERFYALGYACGTAKRFLRKLRANDPQSLLIPHPESRRQPTPSAAFFSLSIPRPAHVVARTHHHPVGRLGLEQVLDPL